MSELPTLIYRHRRENLKKCSLTGLEKKPGFHFFTYPKQTLPPLNHFIVLTLNAKVLTKEDEGFGLVIIDGTWRLAQKMISHVEGGHYRSLPKGFKTAYPRRQEDCPNEEEGLASIEALYIAHLILGKKTEGLLDNYYWKENFLRINHL
jgi:pre-rRNA-processing protein TSR3